MLSADEPVHTFDAVFFFGRTVQGTPQTGDGQAAIRHRCKNRLSQDIASCGMRPSAGIVDNFMGYFLGMPSVISLFGVATAMRSKSTMPVFS
jgi:hypothetical protein